MSPEDPHLASYREQMRGRYPTVELPLDDGVTVSFRFSAPARG